MTQSTEMQVLPLIEIDDPGTAKANLPIAEEKLRAAVAGVTEAEAEHTRRLGIEAEDRCAAQYLRDRITETRRAAQETRSKYYTEVYALREAFDAESVAQNLRRLEDAVAFYLGAYAELVEVLQGLHVLDRWQALAALNRAKEVEADALVTLSHLRTVVTLEAAFEAEGRIGFVGQKTQDLLAAAKEALRIALDTEKGLADARAAYDRQQTVRISKGIGVSKSRSLETEHKRCHKISRFTR